jgi:hypothetical protein
VKTDNWTALLCVKTKLNTLLTTDRLEGPYWQYMDLLAIYNVIGAVVNDMKGDAFKKPEEARK